MELLQETGLLLFIAQHCLLLADVLRTKEAFQRQAQAASVHKAVMLASADIFRVSVSIVDAPQCDLCTALNAKGTNVHAP